MPQISRLDVRGLRGILSQRSLIFDGKSILLFGENGTGKSSFVDSLEWLFTGRITTLDSRAQELSSQKHGPHIRSSAPPFVSLTFSAPENVTIDSMRTPTNISISMGQYLAGAKENLYIMRRSQLSRFIDSQPRDRYSLLRPFIPLGRIDELEESFRNAADLTKEELRKVAYRTDRLVAELKLRFALGSGVAMPTGVDVATSISKSLAEQGLASIDHLGEIAERITSLDAVLSEFGDLSRQSTLLAAIRAIDQVKNSIPVADVEADLDTIISLRQRETREAGVFYESVLEQGAKWIQDERRTDCPLCEQPINPDLVVTRARERLREMQEVVRLRAAARKSSAQAQEATRAALSSINNAIVILGTVPDVRENQALFALRTALTEISQSIQGDLSQIDPAKIRSSLDQFRVGGPHHQALDALHDALQEVLGLLPSQEKARGLLALRQRLQDASRLWSEYQESAKSQHSAASTANVAERIYNTCQAARKEVVQSLYDELSGDINRIYVLFHPGERHGGIHLGIREAVQG